MNMRLGISFLLFAVVCSTVVAQQRGSSRRGYELSIPKNHQASLASPLPAGTYSVGTGGYFSTIGAAFSKLGTDGIAGAVTLELIDTLYQVAADTLGFSLNGPIPGAGPNSRVVLTPATGTKVTLRGNWRYVLSFWNTSYVTLDGVALTGPTTLTVHSLLNAQYVVNRGVGFLYNSDHNVVRHVTMMCDNYLGDGAGIVLAPNSVGSPDSNLIQDCFFKMGNTAVSIYARYASGLPRPRGNIIRGNLIGSEADSLFAWGIQMEKAQATIVEKNIIQNLSISDNQFGYSNGINSYWGNGNTIRNNVVHNIRGGGPYTGGIMLSGDTGEDGSNDSVYNNMVFDIQSKAYNARVLGIQMWHQSSPKVYHNSVYLSGNGNGANSFGSAALYIAYSCGNVDARNNILINARNEAPYSASVIYDYISSNLTSDYNDLDNAPSASNVLVLIGSTKYSTLAEWQAVGRDLHSVSVMPPFVSPQDLHVTYTLTPLADAASLLAGILQDIDGDPRPTQGHPAPDIGADEFPHPPTVGVDEVEGLPRSFALEQNYPNPFNPTTGIRYQLREASEVRLSVCDILGREVAVLVNEKKTPGTYEVKFDAAGLASGVYFYRVTAGDFVQTKKMILVQ